MKRKKNLSCFFENYNLYSLSSLSEIYSLEILCEEYYTAKKFMSEKKVGAKNVGKNF